MNKQSKNYLIISAVTFVFLSGLFSYNIYEIYGQGEKLSKSQILISENLAKDASYNRVVSLIESTKNERRELNNFFLTEKDTVSFISTMENDAKTIGVKMETSNLAVVPAVIKDTKIIEPAKLTLSISFSGSEAVVSKYVSLLENIPYQKSIPELSLSKMDDYSWQGKSTLNITMAP